MPIQLGADTLNVIGTGELYVRINGVWVKASTPLDPREMCDAIGSYWASDPDWTHPADGGQVDSWRDGSGSGLDVTQAGAARPIWRASVPALNNKPAVEFSGSHSLYNAAVAQSAPYTILAVVVPTVDNHHGIAVGIRDDNVEKGLGFKSGSIMANASTGPIMGNNNLDTSGAYLLRLRTNSAYTYLGSPGEIHVELMANEQRIRLSSAAAIDLNGLSIGAGLGAGPTFNNWLQGNVAFVGIYAGDLTQHAQWPTLRDGLGRLYGINLGLDLLDSIPDTNTLLDTTSPNYFLVNNLPDYDRYPGSAGISSSPSDRTWDARTRTVHVNSLAVDGNGVPLVPNEVGQIELVVSGGDGATSETQGSQRQAWIGGLVIDETPTEWTRRYRKDGTGVQGDWDSAGFDGNHISLNSPGWIVIDGVRSRNAQDPFNPRSAGPSFAEGGKLPCAMRISNCWVEGWRDDAIENDGFIQQLLLDDSLFDGGFMFYSVTQAGTVPMWDGNGYAIMRNSLVHLKPQAEIRDGQPGPGNPPAGAIDENGDGHADLWKFQTQSPPIRCENMIFWVERPSVNSLANMRFPPVSNPTHGPSTYQNCTLIWTGGGSYPGEPLPAGITVTSDVQIWNDAVADWKVRHGLSQNATLTDPIPDWDQFLNPTPP